MIVSERDRKIWSELAKENKGKFIGELFLMSDSVR